MDNSLKTTIVSLIIGALAISCGTGPKSTAELNSKDLTNQDVVTNQEVVEYTESTLPANWKGTQFDENQCFEQDDTITIFISSPAESLNCTVEIEYQVLIRTSKDPGYYEAVYDQIDQPLLNKLVRHRIIDEALHASSALLTLYCLEQPLDTVYIKMIAPEEAPKEPTPINQVRI